MNDEGFKLFNGFADGRTDERTFVIVELLSQLKIFFNFQADDVDRFSKCNTDVYNAAAAMLPAIDLCLVSDLEARIKIFLSLCPILPVQLVPTLSSFTNIRNTYQMRSQDG